jgi:hypothetical protein
MQAVRTRGKASVPKTKGDPTARDDWNPYDTVEVFFAVLSCMHLYWGPS